MPGLGGILAGDGGRPGGTSRAQFDDLPPSGAPWGEKTGPGVMPSQKRRAGSGGFKKTYRNPACKGQGSHPSSPAPFPDEARFGRISDPGRCWAPPPMAKVGWTRAFRYVYAAMGAQEGSFHWRLEDSMKAETFSRFQNVPQSVFRLCRWNWIAKALLWMALRIRSDNGRCASDGKDSINDCKS